MKEFLTDEETQSAVKEALNAATTSGDVNGSLKPKIDAIKAQAEKLDSDLLREWQETAKSKIYGEEGQLGLQYPVMLRTLIPVYYNGTKDIDIDVDQVFIPTGTKEDDTDNVFINSEKLHITVKGTNAGNHPKSDLEAARVTKDGIIFATKVKISKQAACAMLSKAYSTPPCGC